MIFFNRGTYTFQFVILIFLYSFNSLFSAEILFLKPKAILNRSIVNLSDLVRLDGKIPDRIIFQNLNSIIKLSKEELSEKLNSEFTIRGSDCLILPIIEEYSKSEIESSLVEELSTKFSMDKTKTRISYLGDSKKFPSENAKLEWDLKNFRPTLGQKLLSLDVYTEGAKIYSFKLKFLLEEKKSSYFAKSDIPKGKLISESDLELREEFSSEAGKSLALNEIVGMQSISKIPSNTLFQKKHFNHAKLITRGSAVEMVYLKGNLFVKGQGIAKNSASEGELVKVTSNSNHQTILCRAMEKGVVVVE